jgi:hypothetical protein
MPCPAGALDLLYSLGMEEKIRAAGFYYIDKIRLVSPKGYSMDADLEEDHHKSSARPLSRACSLMLCCTNMP